MYLAWQLSLEDVEVVLKRNNVSKTEDEVLDIFEKIDNLSPAHSLL